METLEPVRNGTEEVSALCSAGPVRSKVLQTSNRAGISNGLERIRSDSTEKEREKQKEKRCSKRYFALRFLRNPDRIGTPEPNSKSVASSGILTALWLVNRKHLFGIIYG